MNFAKFYGFIGAAFCAAALAPVAGAQTYVVTDLGTLGGSASFGFGVNDSGTVVGYSNVNGGSDSSAFAYTNGALTNLGTLGNKTNSEALGVNNSGTVVGDAFLGGSTTHAFAYTNGGINDLGTLGGTRSYGTAINTAGVATGFSELNVGSSVAHAFTYDTTKIGTAQMKDLGTLGGNFSYGYGINDSGVVVGASNPTGMSNNHAFISTATGLTDIGTLGGANSYARGINKDGVTVGYSDVKITGATVASQQAFIYTAAGGMQPIGTPAAKSLSTFAYAINNAGDVVGNTLTQSGSVTVSSAFLYSNGSMVPLNSLNSSWNFQYAYGINNNGTIVGYGVNPKGATHAFALSRATPAPSSLLLAVFGAGGIALAVRRKPKTQRE